MLVAEGNTSYVYVRVDELVSKAMTNTYYTIESFGWSGVVIVHLISLKRNGESQPIEVG